MVVHFETAVVLDRHKSVHVASGEVHNVDVVPDAGAIRCVIVVPNKNAASPAFAMHPE